MLHELRPVDARATVGMHRQTALLRSHNRDGTLALLHDLQFRDQLPGVEVDRAALDVSSDDERPGRFRFVGLDRIGHGRVRYRILTKRTYPLRMTRRAALGILENESKEVQAPDLPNGIIDSPELFLLAIKVGTGGHEFRTGALEFLEKQIHEDLAKIGATGSRVNVMAYWTGAYLGLRVANRGYALRQQQQLQEAKEKKEVKLYH